MDSKASTGPVLGLQGGYTKLIPYSDDTFTNGGGMIGGLFGYDVKINTRFSLGMETGYKYGFEVARNNGQSSDIKSFPLLLTAKTYIPDSGFNFLLKGGFQRNSIEGGALTENVNWDPVAALGIGYQYDNINMFVEYQYSFGDKWHETTPPARNNVPSFNYLAFGIAMKMPVKKEDFYAN
jgi:hypothetical protein